MVAFRVPPASRQHRRDSHPERHAAIPAEWSRQQASGVDPIYEGQQPPLYHWLSYLPLKLAAGLSLPSRVFHLRCFSVALVSLAIPLGFALSRRVFASGPVALGIIALATVTPGCMVNICRIDNDSPSLLIYTLLLCLLLPMLKAPASFRYFLTALPAVLFLCC